MVTRPYTWGVAVRVPVLDMSPDNPFPASRFDSWQMCPKAGLALRAEEMTGFPNASSACCTSTGPVRRLTWKPC